MNYLLPKEVRDAILGYLHRQPYGDVARGVAMLEGLEEIPEPKRGPALASCCGGCQSSTDPAVRSIVTEKE